MKLLFSEWLNESVEYTEKDFKGRYVPAEIIDRMLAIEKAAYPEHMRIFHQAIEENDLDTTKITAQELHDYLECGGNLRFILGTDWLILACDEGDHVEIHDLASAKKRLGMSEISRIIGFLKSFGKKRIEAAAKQDTSYPLLLSMAQHGKIKLMQDEVRDWDGTPMHDVVFQFV